MIAVAKVLRPHGVKGALAVTLLTSGPARLKQLGAVYLGRHEDDESCATYGVRRVRTGGGRVLVELDGITDLDSAEATRGMLLLIPDEAAAPLPPGQYYHHEIVGCTVADDSGDFLGTVRDVMEMPAQDIYVVERPDCTWWLPAAKGLIQRIDVASKRITVRAIDGLLDTGPPR